MTSYRAIGLFLVLIVACSQCASGQSAINSISLQDHGRLLNEEDTCFSNPFSADFQVTRPVGFSLDLSLASSDESNDPGSGFVLPSGPLVKMDEKSPPISLDQKPQGRFHNGILSAFYLPSDHRNTGFLDFNTYWDTRDFSVLTINAGAKLPYDFEYFQFVNFTSPLDDPSEL